MPCALLVIDMQKALFELKQPVYAADALVRSVDAAVGTARTHGMRIVFTQHENKSFLIKGTPGWQIADGIDVRENDVMSFRVSAALEKSHV